MLVGAAAAVTTAALTVAGVALTRSPESAAPAFVAAPAAPAAPAAAEASAAPAPTGPPPGPATSRSLDLDGKPVVADGRETVRLPRRSVARFSLLGVTWDDALLSFRGDAAVRTRSAASGDWSSWRSLDLEPVVAAGDPDVVAGRTRGGSQGLWVGPSDGVEVRVVSAGGRTSHELPDGLRLTLVDPDRPAGGGRSGGQGGGMVLAEPSDGPSASFSAGPSPTTSSTPAPTPTAVPPVVRVPMPAYVNRKGWAADETLVKDAPTYATTVNALFVHHTSQAGAQSNAYTCAEAAKVVRSIFTYAVTGKGLSDIEYNFLVDKCGTLYEGRKGGVDRPVVGAHTPPFNTGYAAVAVLGDFTTAAVATAVTTKISQLAAYKLGLYGHDPFTRFTTTALAGNNLVKTGDQVTMSRLAAHRDVEATECPGTVLNARLPALRTETAGLLAGLKVTGLTGGRASGSTYVVRDTVKVAWSVTTPGGEGSSFDVLVDGKPAGTAAAGTTSASVKLAAGRHTVQVRLNRADGTAAVSDSRTVVADTTKPAFPGKPEVGLRTGTVSATSAPVKLTWQATDAVGLVSVQLTAPGRATFGPTVRSWDTTAKPGATTAWKLQGVDLAGNIGPASVARKPTLVAETKAKRSGKWTKAAGNSHLGRAALAATAKNASLSWTFTGRSAALVMLKSKTAGKAYVYVDGKKVSTLDLKAGTTAYRQAVWTRSWASAGRHTVKLVVAGTKGRPKVTTDGIVYLP